MHIFGFAGKVDAGERPRVALDIDGPAEVARLMRMRSSTRARAVLARHGIGMVG